MSRRPKLLSMLQDDPNDPFLHYALGLDYVKTGETDSARDSFQQTIALDPNYVAAYHQLGILWGEQNQLELAREILRQGVAVARKTGNQHAESELGELLSRLA